MSADFLSTSSNKYITTKTTKEFEKKQDEKKNFTFRIPAGTTMRPFNFSDDSDPNFFITIEEDIDLEIKNVMTVSINGIVHNVLPKNVNAELRSIRRKNDFIIKAGTKYRINDIKKDPIGLTHVFDIDQRLAIAPGSIVTLFKGSLIAMSHESIAIHSCNFQNIHCLTQHDVKCEF